MKTVSILWSYQENKESGFKPLSSSKFYTPLYSPKWILRNMSAWYILTSKRIECFFVPLSVCPFFWPDWFVCNCHLVIIWTGKAPNVEVELHLMVWRGTKFSDQRNRMKPIKQTYKHLIIEEESFIFRSARTSSIAFVCKTFRQSHWWNKGHYQTYCDLEVLF